MRKQRVDQLKPGMVLGQTLYNRNGDLLLMKGVTLTSAYIESLQGQGFYMVYVRDGIADDVEPPEILSVKVRSTTTKHVQDLYAAVARAGRGETGMDRVRTMVQGAAAVRSHSTRLKKDVEAIVAEVADVRVLPGVPPLKSKDSYTFEHSLDVTVAAIVLGKRFHMPSDDLRQLALGCLCHDIGELVVPDAILGKPSRLSREEFALVQQHPEAGYETMRQLTEDTDIIARHLVRQHHESQDGNGYPRHLHGSNQFSSRRQYRMGDGLMLPEAEIAAVADVYSALASDRPYRPALSPDQIVVTLRGMAGKQLNQEIVHRFLTLLPSFPVGTKVAAITGRYRGYRGVVVAMNPGDVHHPRVRFLFNHEGRRIDPVQVDTAREESDLATLPQAMQLEPEPVLSGRQ